MDFADGFRFWSFDVFHKKLLALTGALLALTLLSAQPVLAQDPGMRVNETSDRASGNIRGDRVLPGRMSDGARERRDRRNRESEQEEAAAKAAATPEENRAAAQALLTAAGIGCQVSEAALLGVTAEQHSTYEAVCAEGPGYLAVNSTPPQTFNCLELAGQAETTRLRDPEADVGQQCTLPVNLNPVPVLSAYARAASVDCTVDQGSAIGKSTAGNVIYEIGCADRDGYWLENAGGTWQATPCWDLALQQDTCRYTTADESAGAWSTVLAGTDAAACDVQQALGVAADPAGLLVYEVKCGAGNGFFARVGSRFTAERVHNCIEAATIAGGCTLSAAAPATTEQ